MSSSVPIKVFFNDPENMVSLIYLLVIILQFVSFSDQDSSQYSSRFRRFEKSQFLFRFQFCIISFQVFQEFFKSPKYG